MKLLFTKFRAFALLLLLVIGITTVSCWRRGSAEGKKIERIVFISIDTCRADYLSCYGYRRKTTPNIDELAKEGMLFENVISPVPLTLPAHSSMLTGTIPPYHGVHDNTHYKLASSNITLAEILKEAGFTTSAFISAFVLDSQFGLNQGFDINIGGNHQGGPGGEGSFFDPYALGNLKGRKPAQYMPDRMAEEAVDFMKKQKAAGKPFFVCLWNYTVHWPVEAPDHLYRKYATGKPNLHQKYQAMVEGMDIAVGKVLAEMDAMGVTNETLVVFTSDNGPFTGDNDEITDAKPLKGAKGYLSEGGIRVPLIICWPGKVKPAALCTEPVVTMGFVPMFLDAAGVNYRRCEFDGETLLPPLTQSGKLVRDAIYFHFPHYAFHRDNRMGSVIRSGDYKLIKLHKTGDLELYNLATDLGETNNLTKTLPEVASRLNAQLDNWLIETKAAMPRPMKDIPENGLHG